MANSLPKNVQTEIRKAVYKKAEEFGYMECGRIESGRFIDTLVEDPEVGCVLIEYLPKERVRTYIKDGVLNAYAKNLTKKALARVRPDRGNYCSVRNPRQILLRQGLPGVLFMRIPVRSWPRPPEYPRIRCHCSGSPPSVGSVCSISRPSHAPRSSE